MVVITARWTPMWRWAISMTGVMQLVVQLAQEMICGRTVGVVHAVHHGGHCLRRRRRGKDHVRGTGLNVLRQIVLAFEDAGAFQHQVDAEVGPRQVRRVTFGERRDPLTVDEQRPVRGGDPRW